MNEDKPDIMPDDTPAGRREFFAASLEWMLRPVSKRLEKHIHIPRSRPCIRPPGALPEDEFLESCSRCQMCIKVCPAHAIQALDKPDSPDHRTPFIDPDMAACTLCRSLACMSHCPTGALEVLADPHHIRIGLAKVNETTCRRSKGDECQECLDVCPMGEAAIFLSKEGKVIVNPEGCIGCGRCQNRCPAEPRAIVVTPM